MKKTILVAAVWMGVSAASFAGINTNTNGSAIEVREDNAVDLNVEAFQDLKFKLSVKNLSNRTYIAIKKSTGEVLYSEYTGKAENYTKIFDLSNLLDGEYVFVVETGKGYVEKPFSITTETTRVVTAKAAE
ncbi:hypothetical protein [Arundinibacter roseus]|uniref:Por secretion system C-terminal sorting domain-containing protein n=1 Tax=Arundinibacter roseus TaxID=2070510 RepID=A0A4R4K7Y0_9BACT|nr:hypothetical protein [Arundinibacter roseus]TDB63774.1 hypothetical protein EZE20_15900 [Arundinibacter roseus]